MRIAIIGAGSLGTALAKAFDNRGHDVTIASRREESSARAVSGLTKARAGTPVDAVLNADVVVLTVPFEGVADALEPIDDLLDGVVLWSCVNALKPDLSGLAVGFSDSAAETVARYAPRARVVAALPPFASALADGLPDYSGVGPSTFLCGDDPDAKEIVAQLVAELGATPVDIGGLAASRLAEPAMMLLVTVAYSGPKPRDVALALVEHLP
jgi:predicted dinucleotide-binding enzyme